MKQVFILQLIAPVPMLMQVKLMVVGVTCGVPMCYTHNHVHRLVASCSTSLLTMQMGPPTYAMHKSCKTWAWLAS